MKLFVKFEDVNSIEINPIIEFPSMTKLLVIFRTQVAIVTLLLMVFNVLSNINNMLWYFATFENVQFDLKSIPQIKY